MIYNHTHSHTNLILNTTLILTQHLEPIPKPYNKCDMISTCATVNVRSSLNVISITSVVTGSGSCSFTETLTLAGTYFRFYH